MSSSDYSDLSNEQLVVIDMACDAFEATLELEKPAKIEDQLASVDATLRLPLLRELLAAEVTYKRRQGEEVLCAEYETRFPDALGTVRGVLGELASSGGNDRTRASRQGDTQMFSLGQPASKRDTQESVDDVTFDPPREFGRYRLLKLLGRGGMGVVFLAHDTQLDRQVALKMPDFGDRANMNPELIDRFYREARSMASVTHPNLCTIHDVAEQDGRHYLTMTYIDGESLADKLQATEPLQPHHAGDLVRQLALAIQAAHEVGVIHRDLKPSNVMIDRNGTPFITDFGLASRNQRGEAELTQRGAVIGSPGYMAPEQVGGNRSAIGPRTDVYALGVILYRLVCGCRPFEGSALEVIGQIASGKPPTPPSELTDVDQRIEAICLKAMACNVADRFQSAAELADSLTFYLDPKRRSTGDVISRPSRATWMATLLGVSALFGLAWAGHAVVRSYWPAAANSRGNVVTHYPRESAGPHVSQLGSARPAQRLLPPLPTPSKSSSGHLDLSGQEFGQSQARAVAAGDVDRDGSVDLWIAQDGTPSQLWLNDGTGQFSIGQEFESASCGDVELGDLDQDGDFDAFVVCRDGPSVVWRNDGRGEFVRFGEIELLRPNCVALGDIDNDGDLDAVVGGSDDAPANRILINNGDATFQDPGQRLGASNTLGIALGDFDADGDLDIFASSWEGGSEVWQNDGSGNFSDTGQRLGDGNYHGVALADIDRDGDIDACVAARGEPSRLWVNDGAGRFSNRELAEKDTSTFSIAIADFNGDGQQDVLLGNQATDGYTHYPNQFLLCAGPGWEIRWLHSEATNDLAVADFDNDGDLDAFLANSEEQPSQLWLNRDLGEAKPPSPFAFRDSGQRLGRANSNEVELGDLDGDGDLDAVVANTDGQANIAWMNDGRGEFSAGSRLSEPVAAMDVALGDIDGDGDLDVFLTNKAGPNRIWLNDSKGNLELTDQRIGNSSSNQVLLADFDNDDDLDAWIGNFNPDHDRVWINDSTGRFTDSGQLLGADRTYSVHCVDIDNNGTLDVLVGTGSNAANVLWLNDGNGTFSKSEQVLSGMIGSNGFANGDLNGDGSPDLYESGWLYPDRIWINNGEGVFTQSQQPGPCLRSRRTQLADFDGDGDLDVVVANEVYLPNVVCANDGSGTFSAPIQYMGSEDTRSVAVGDLDGDGDIDIFAANNSNSPNQVWLNLRFEN